MPQIVNMVQQIEHVQLFVTANKSIAAISSNVECDSSSESVNFF